MEPQHALPTRAEMSAGNNTFSRLILVHWRPAILFDTMDLSCGKYAEDLTCRRYAADEMMVPNNPWSDWMPAAAQQQAIAFSLRRGNEASRSGEARIAGRIT
jgi:hypothetical protein